LIETLAQRLLDLVLNFGGPMSPILKAEITVHKPSAPVAAKVSDISVSTTAKRCRSIR
ncbi:MAG: hypothetical protein RLZZ603_1203, partial [Actinomycetota bacterium]